MVAPTRVDVTDVVPSSKSATFVTVESPLLGFGRSLARSMYLVRLCVRANALSSIKDKPSSSGGGEAVVGKEMAAVRENVSDC